MYDAFGDFCRKHSVVEFNRCFIYFKDVKEITAEIRQ